MMKRSLRTSITSFWTVTHDNDLLYRSLVDLVIKTQIAGIGGVRMSHLHFKQLHTFAMCRRQFHKSQ